MSLRYNSRRLQTFWLFLLSSLCFHCTTVPDGELGLQGENQAFIPARVAVLSCQPWPKAAPFQGLQTSNVSDQDLQSLCEKFDQFILHGFSGQPYMRGLSPKLVTQLLEKAEEEAKAAKEEDEADQKQASEANAATETSKDEEPSDSEEDANAIGPAMLTQIPELWHQQANSCQQCMDAIAYYQQSIASRPAWLDWLNRFSRGAYNADSLLIPFIMHAQEIKGDDRGILIAKREAKARLFLVDTNNGQLIWAGGRTASVFNRDRQQLDADKLNFPSWDELGNRLFRNDIWQQYPGRQNF